MLLQHTINESALSAVSTALPLLKAWPRDVQVTSHLMALATTHPQQGLSNALFTRINRLLQGSDS